MTNEEARKMATKMAIDLFTDSTGKSARRLKMDYSGNEGGTGWSIDAVEERLTKALQEASTAVPAGCVRDENGVDRKVLGTLPLTKDGCVVGVDAVVFHPDSICVSGEAVYEGNRVDVPTKRGSDNFICRSFDTTVEDCYSTREAASSALSSTEKQ